METHRSESQSAIAKAKEREATRRMQQQQQGQGQGQDQGAGGLAATPRQSSQEPYGNYRLASGLSPRQPYSFTRSQSTDAGSKSYNTEDLIRKYGNVTGIPPVPPAARPTTPSSMPATPQNIRSEAMKVLDLVDDHLNTPLDVRRTMSGGFRMAPAVRRSTSGAMDGSSSQGYAVQRTASGSFSSGPSNANNRGGRRVPAAVSGINYSSNKEPNWRSGRYSFTDPSFRDDDHISEDEDEIIMSRGKRFHVPQDTTDVVDIQRLEGRSAGSRATDDEKKFDGDFPQSSAWSSRYSDTYTTQRRLLDQWDQEFEGENSSDRQGAQTMFMASASNIRDAANNALAAASQQSSRVFGAGFSFRQNHVYGNHADSKADVNLRTVWKDVSEDDALYGTGRVHKTWQEVLLNKRKRRRLLALGVLFCLAIIMLSITVTTIKKNSGMRYSGISIGAPVTFYVTSDVPYDTAGEDKLVKDLAVLPGDAEFAMHLGNIQDAGATFCPSSSYSGVASMLQKSPVPLFMMPGAEDWVNCPDQEKSLQRWRDSFVRFDEKKGHAFKVFRDKEHPEAFAFLHSGVLFVGLHLVSGPVGDHDAWELREKEMVSFYFGMTNLNKEQFRAIVILGNARPGPQQEEFFSSIFSSFKKVKVPVAYVHANSGRGQIGVYSPFDNQPNLVGIEIENGNENPPLKITVGHGARPFLVG